MVETPSMHLQRPERTSHNSQNEVTRTISPITCVICEAMYTPSHPYKHFLQGSPVVLESAFMSMCHFCFRCRRPACPECWDAVHGICGACVQDANLHFRTQVEPLDGVLLLPVPLRSSTTQAETSQENSASSLFICVKHGKFHLSGAPSNGISNIQTIETAIIESNGKPSERLPNIAQEPPTSSEMQANPRIAVSLGNSLGTGFSTALEAAPAPDLEVASTIEATPTQEAVPVKHGGSVVKKVELVLTVIVALVLLAIAVVIGLAEYFPAVNAFIFHLLHVDIRTEIAYLLYLVQQHL